MFKFLTFEIQNFQTTRMEKITKMRVVDLEKLNNLILDKFFLFKIIAPRKITLEFPHVWNLNFQTSSDREMTKTKVVDLEKLNNSVVDKFFIWNHLSMKDYVWISHIWNLKFQRISDGEITKTKIVDLKKL
jgi:hypothetical protein